MWGVRGFALTVPNRPRVALTHTTASHTCLASPTCLSHGEDAHRGGEDSSQVGGMRMVDPARLRTGSVPLLPPRKMFHMLGCLPSVLDTVRTDAHTHRAHWPASSMCLLRGLTRQLNCRCATARHSHSTLCTTPFVSPHQGSASKCIRDSIKSSVRRLRNQDIAHEPESETLRLKVNE
jgi:hypothetical protein